jgi:hypothetical protein
MKRLFLYAVFALYITFLCPGDEPKAAPGIIPELLWTGSWESEKNLSGRLRLSLEMPSPGLTFHVQLTDRRPASSWDLFTESFLNKPAALTALSLGIRHEATDSLFLYGMTDTYGLAARIKNPWIRGSPFPENHAESYSGLKTESSTTARPAFYLYLGSPELKLDAGRLRAVEFFAAFSLESVGEQGNTFSFSAGKSAFSAGGSINFTGNSSIRLEVYHTEGMIREKNLDTWFEAKPALPERKFRVYAGSLILDSPLFGFAADGSWSETFAYGRDFYGNLGFRLGNRPWRFSLAADGSGSRYTGPDGGENGAALRFAARLERRGKRGSLFRLDALVRSSETGESQAENLWELAEELNRFSLGAYYRFPTDRSALAVSRLSFKFSGDSRDSKNQILGTEALAALKVWEIHSETQFKLSLLRKKDESPFGFDSFTLKENLLWNNDFLQLGAGLGCVFQKDKDPAWNTFLSSTLRLQKKRWIRVKLDSPKFPVDWAFVLSWHAEW